MIVENFVIDDFGWSNGYNLVMVFEQFGEGVVGVLVFGYLVKWFVIGFFVDFMLVEVQYVVIWIVWFGVVIWLVIIDYDVFNVLCVGVKMFSDVEGFEYVLGCIGQC